MQRLGVYDPQCSLHLILFLFDDDDDDDDDEMTSSSSKCYGRWLPGWRKGADGQNVPLEHFRGECNLTVAPGMPLPPPIASLCSEGLSGEASQSVRDVLEEVQAEFKEKIGRDGEVRACELFRA